MALQALPWIGGAPDGRVRATREIGSESPAAADLREQHRDRDFALLWLGDGDVGTSFPAAGKTEPEVCPDARVSSDAAATLLLQQTIHAHKAALSIA